MIIELQQWSKLGLLKKDGENEINPRDRAFYHHKLFMLHLSTNTLESEDPEYMPSMGTQSQHARIKETNMSWNLEDGKYGTQQ